MKKFVNKALVRLGGSLSDPELMALGRGIMKIAVATMMTLAMLGSTALIAIASNALEAAVPGIGIELLLFRVTGLIMQALTLAGWIWTSWKGLKGS